MAKVNPGKSVSSIIMLLLLLAVAWQQQWLPQAPPAASVPGHGSDAGLAGNTAIVRAFAEQRSNLQVQGQGVVQRVLPPDNDGNPHQRFIVRLDAGHTVLIAHNLTLAPAVAGLSRGDQVGFYGEYEWNPRGGVIHWTHHDPQGRHADGWVEHAGRRYQ